MEAFVEYILKSSIFLSFLIVFYRLILKNETYFKLNRLFLLLNILFSCLIIPFAENIFRSNGTLIAGFQLPEITINNRFYSESDVTANNLLSSIFDFYLLICAILLFRLLIQILQIIRLFIVSNNYNENSTLIYTDDHPPFSFFNLIFINKITSKDDIEKIVLHESIHAKQCHSLDILLIEIICIFHWFNPFVWLYKASVREIHEYLADEGVISKTYNKQAYQTLMLSVATGINGWELSNKFNSLIKNRMIMMSKQKSTKTSLIKYVLVMPLIGLLLILPSIKIEKAFASETISNAKKVPVLLTIPQSKDEVFTVVEKAPEFIGGQSAMVDFIIKHIIYPENEREKGIEGTVYVTFVVEKDGSINEAKVLKGVQTALDKEALRVVKLMSKKWKAGTQRGEAVRVQFNLPIKFKLDKEKKQ